MAGGCLAAAEDWRGARLTLDEHDGGTATSSARHRFPVFTFGGQEVKGKTIRYAHMATVAVLPNGTMVSAWQASALYEGASDQRIYWSTSDDCGHSWGAPIKLDVPMTMPGGAAQWSPVLWLEPPMRGGSGGDSQRRLLLFYTQSSRRECVRPAAGKQPKLWVPGGDIKMTALMETLPTPRTGVSEGEDPSAARIAEWGYEGADNTGAGGGAGRGWTSRWAPPRIIYSEDAEGFIPKVITTPP